MKDAGEGAGEGAEKLLLEELLAGTGEGAG